MLHLICLGFATRIKILHTKPHIYLEEEFREISELAFSYISFFSAEENGILRNSFSFNLPEGSFT